MDQLQGMDGSATRPASGLCGAASGVVLALIAQVGKQVDFLRTLA
jgi:hypothetical protein